MEVVHVIRGEYPGLFGGVGYHNNDAMLYHLIDRDFFWETVCKCYREISPGFMRTFAGFYNWTKKAMDNFAEYYELMQKWTDTPMYLTVPTCPLHFSDEEITEYCEQVADRLAYLYYEKDVKHIRYYCLSNEMTRMHWGNLMEDLPTFKKYHEAFYRAFQKRNLPIGLLATDASEYENWKTVDWAMDNMDEITDDACVHIYERQHDPHDPEFYGFFYDKCREIVQRCITNRKRVILGECGVQKLPEVRLNDSPESAQMSYLKGVIVDTCRYYNIPEEAAYIGLMLTEMSFAAINAGVYAIAYWTFIDCPDPYTCRYSSREGFSQTWGEYEAFITSSMRTKYNKWGSFKWEDDGNHDPRPHYWAMAPLMKFFGRNKKVFDSYCNDPLLRSCAVADRFDGSVTVGIVNRHTEPTEITLDTSLFRKPIRVYEYDPADVPFNTFGDMQDYSAVLDPVSPVYTLRPESVTYFTTDYITKDAPVYADNVHEQDGELIWDRTDAPNHCYYRIYKGTCSDFVPGRDNQIGSTAAEFFTLKDDASLSSADGKGIYYKVLSVDTSGNV